MATELVTFKMEKKFLKQVDRTVKESTYQNRTEFIRAALREKMDEEKLKKAMAELAPLRGSLRKGRQTTDEEIHRIRELAFQELEKKFK